MASCTPPSIKPAAFGEKQYYVNLLTMYLPALTAKLDVASFTPYLASEFLLNLDEIKDINERASRDQKSAVVKLMNILAKSRDPEWFHKFKDALRKSGNQIIFKLMNEEDTEDEEVYEKLLLMHYREVIERIDPMELLPILLQKGTITQSDYELIGAERQNNGSIRGATKLLTCIYCRKSGWFVDFIAALKEANYIPLVELIGPGLGSAKSDMSIAREAEIIAKKNSGVKRGCGSNRAVNNVGVESSRVVKKSHSSSLTDNCTSAPTESKQDFRQDSSSTKDDDTKVKRGCESNRAERNVGVESSKVAERSHSSSLTDNSSSAPTESKQDFHQDSSSVKDDDTSFGNIVNLMDDDELRNLLLDDKSNQDGASSLCGLLSGHGIGSSAPERLRQQSRANATAPVNEDRTMTDGCSGFAFKSDACCQGNDLSRTSSRAASAPKLPTLPASVNIFESTMTTVEEEEDIPVKKEKLELRGYQKELVEKGVDGKNCVIVAPTGSGKTLVAIYISQHHLESSPEEDRKILFFVPKVALVQQQRRQYLTYMDDDCKVFSVSGEKDAQMSLKEIIEKNDVIVLTPQILVNAIDSGDMDEPFSQVTLMIFDECHHAMKDHPYNNIMSRYIDIVLSRDEEKILHLPQVIGLTASPGVGKAKSDEDAIEHLIKLCANLDASEICTVRDKKHLAELQQNVNIPIEDIEDVKGRVIDRFHEVISKIMGEIEGKMRQRTDISKLMVEVPNIQKVLEPPTRGIEAYTQFLAQLKREVAKIYDQEIRRFFFSCQEHLEVYNNALLVNADCRTIDALDFIKRVLERNSGRTASLTNNETDRWLNRLFDARAMRLEEISESPEAANPKLKYLENRILGFYHENPNSQGIIFCKTRFMTDALVKWIKDTPRLAFLNPNILVGSGSTTTRAAALNPVSMTHRKLDDVLMHFKDGVHKIIVATSVAEEGLDVKSCNYVIRYEHVSNDIARVQSRGRARAQDGQFVLIAEKGRGVHEREMTNQVREVLMGRAIFLLHQIPEDTMRSRIMIQQQLAKNERDMAAEAKVANAKWKASRCHEGEYQLRCLKCNALGVWHEDLRTIKGSHHVVLDPEFKTRIFIEPHPRPKAYDDFEKKGKLLCTMCGNDWGISALYKTIPVYMLKVSSFAVEDPNSQRLTYKKWKEVPFPVNELLPEDMQILPSVFLGSQFSS